MHFHDNYATATAVVAERDVLRSHRLLDNEPLQAFPITPGKAGDNYAVIKKGGFVLLDFGVELRGGIALCIRDVSCFPETAKCRVTFGESVMEALSSIGKKNATNDHAIRDTVIDVPIMGNIYYGNTGFRFVRLEALNADITVKGIKAELDMLDILPIGSFSCSDERITKIWEVGAYTVYLNMGEYVWDGIKRDRMVWLGDLHPEASTIYSVYGAHESVKRSMDLAKHETPSTEWINNIPSYSLWWVINQYDWYMHTADIEYLRAQRLYVEQIIDRALETVKADPSVQEFDFFVDWSSNSDKSVARVGFYAVMNRAFLAAERIGDELGCESLAEKGRRGSALVLSLGLEIPNQKQMAGVGAWGGLFDAGKANEQVLSRDPYDGLSTFMGYYVLKSRAEAADMRGALSVIYSYWGAMLDLGATTFFEDFDISWTRSGFTIDAIVPEGELDPHGDCGRFCYQQFRHSLCHGWASGPTAFLTEYMLGVRVAEPGCRRLIIKPDLGGLSYARGSFPTPYGEVKISHEIINGEIISEIVAPEEVKIDLVGCRYAD